MNSISRVLWSSTPARLSLLAVVLMVALVTANHADVMARSLDQKVDLEAVLFGEAKFTPVCCCTLKGSALERRLDGAKQDGLDFLPKGDVYEVFLRLAPRSFASIGYTTHHADGSMSVTGPNGRGSLLLSAVDDDTWSWVAYTDDVEAGRGQLTK